MKIFVTNLEKSIDRRNLMSDQLDRLKLDFEFVKCVVGKELTEQELSLHCDMNAIHNHNKKNHWFNKGIIGCTITNQNVYKDIINRKIDVALYLEDDVLLSEELPKILNFVEKNIQPGDVYLLHWSSFKKIRLLNTNMNTEMNIKVYKPEDSRSIASGSAFVITKEAAKRMLKENTPIHITPDCWSYFLETGAIGKLYCLYPKVIEIANIQSTMEIGGMIKIRQFIYKYRIFPFYQLMSYYRSRVRKKMSKVEIVD